MTQLSYSNYVVVYQERKRGVTIHVVDKNGLRVPGAAVKLSQLSTDFPIGTMISRTILENLPYQVCFFFFFVVVELLLEKFVILMIEQCYFRNGFSSDSKQQFLKMS